MKRIVLIWLGAMMLTGSLTALAGAQSQPLGDYARAARKDKEKAQPAVKKYDNDNLPVNDKLSVVGAPAEETQDKTATAQANPTSNGGNQETGKKTESQPGESAADRQKMYDDWKKKIAEKKDGVDLKTRELDVVQREYRLRAAAMYADVGNRLRNAAAWDKEDAQYKQQIAEKQKALDAAKQQLADMQEQARKAGVPANARQ